MQSMLDTDTYKLTQQMGVLELFPNTHVEYNFINRSILNGKYQFNNKFLKGLLNSINLLCELRFTKDDLEWLEAKCKWVKPWYLSYLKDYQFDIRDLTIFLDSDQQLNIKIAGPWHKTILWEVPLMATISENYFEYIDTEWDEIGQDKLMYQKAAAFQADRVKVSDFGTRRRRTFEAQERAVRILAGNLNTFVGTSNLHLAKQYNVTPIGTVAHEWYMAHAAMVGLERANRHALLNWNRIFNGYTQIALTDTFTTDVFLRDFDSNLAKVYDGVREDSGDPYKFMCKFVDHYRNLGINPAHKIFISSNGLTTQKSIDIKKYHSNKVGGTENNFIAAIGTHLTNDYVNSPPLQIVIKLGKVNNKPVVKLSDDLAKASGERDALRATKYFLFGTPLDEVVEKKNDIVVPIEQTIWKYENGVKTYRKQNGQIHREDGPACTYPDGSESWYINNQLHREDGPACITAIKKEWRIRGNLHREDGPAIEYASGAKEWYQHGERHRDNDLPAVESDSEKFWYKHGKLHRNDGPACEYQDGGRRWYQNGLLHRLDGPAVAYVNGAGEYWIHDKQYVRSYWNILVQKMQAENDVVKTDAPSDKVDTFRFVDENTKTVSYMRAGKLHRDDDLPAIESANGHKQWYRNGLLHRDNDKPAVEQGDNKYWWQQGQFIKQYVLGKWLNLSNQLHSFDDLPAIVHVNGDKCWYQNGRYHRDNDLPAIVYANGDKEWCQHGERHRDNDLPAVEHAGNVKAWWQNGKRHRDNDLPAVEHAGGQKEWWQNGKRHRDNGQPAIEYGNGDKEWYQHGKLHRFNGPAIVYVHGRKEWYEFGTQIKPPIEDNHGTKSWHNEKGELHRDHDLPAVEYHNGMKEWYQNGKHHRDNDLPAIIYANGNKIWFQHGLLHRDNDLPAMEHINGDKQWYIKGLRQYDSI